MVGIYYVFSQGEVVVAGISEMRGGGGNNWDSRFVDEVDDRSISVSMRSTHQIKNAPSRSQ